MATELRKLGATVEEGADFISVTQGVSVLSPHGGIDTYDDHRIAMCFSLAAFATTVRINDPGCVAKPSRLFRAFLCSDAGCSGDCHRRAFCIRQRYCGGPCGGRVGLALPRLRCFVSSDRSAARRAGVVAWDDERAVAVLPPGSMVFSEGFHRSVLAGKRSARPSATRILFVRCLQVAALPAVRAALLFRQRVFRQAPGLVADGRDMASVVFPDAPTKVFLTASVDASWSDAISS